jgi:hypothetical protein
MVFAIVLGVIQCGVLSCATVEAQRVADEPGTAWQVVGRLHRVPPSYSCSGVMGLHYNLVELELESVPDGFPENYVYRAAAKLYIRVAFPCVLELEGTAPESRRGSGRGDRWCISIRRGRVDSLIWFPGEPYGRYLLLADFRRCGRGGWGGVYDPVYGGVAAGDRHAGKG